MWDFSYFELTPSNTISVFVIFVTFCCLVKKTRDVGNVRISSCPNPDCARCKIMRKFERTRSAMKTKLSNLLHDQPETGSSLTRIQTMLYQANNSSVWCLDGVNLPPWVHHDVKNPDLLKLHQDLSSQFLSHKSLQLMLLDYHQAEQNVDQWKINNVPTGTWKVYHLMDQGVWQGDRTSCCPNIMQLLGKIIPQLMVNNVYGNVLLSVLEPGSSIEPHFGPCNYRLRCHIPILPSTGFCIRVGTEIHSWEEGKILLFSDHHEHEVWHIQQAGSKPASRVVLIVDIWHPSITSEEKLILNQLFADK